ncbi:hypothetical protein HS088_TW14G00634 [Tripterygium wilfordii]|uniref:NAB domain-containing protein n=1 Tax=Tripterygium wilfordii TaxID=458696 RepID=A0A7J7CR03_TRIWF|nr:hypothetical protein HS088_TW14G00634 [Tripterygium wilfordii]
MDKTVKQLLKRIEEDVKYLAKKCGIYCQNKPEMIAKVEDLYSMCQSLAEDYDHLTEELQETVGSELQTQYIENFELGFDQDSTLQTPNYKQGLYKSVDGVVTLSSGGDNSTFYLKEGTESSPSSSSDSESESFLSANNNLSISRNSDRGLHKKIFEFQADIPSIKQKLQGVDEELEGSKERIKESDQELADLKRELQRTHQVQCTLDLALEDIVTLKDELEAEREHNSELKERFAAVNDGLREESVQLQSDISSLKEKQNLLESTLNEWELKVYFLEDKLRQCEAEKIKMKILHDAQETELQGQINQMKVVFAERGGHVEALNKELDKLTLKYDMLMAER